MTDNDYSTHPAQGAPDARSKSPPSRGEEATSLALLGWYVFPVWGVVAGKCMCGDPDCPNAGKHPVSHLAPHGYKDASRFALTVHEWWQQGDWNVGIALALSGLVALDLDPRHGSDETFASLLGGLGELPPTVESSTGGGGRHLIFRAHDGDTYQGKLGTGVDIKYDGYIVAPPSVHASGVAYEWAAGGSPVERKPARQPASWRKQTLRKPRSAEPQVRRDGSVPEGERHDHLARLAGTLARAGASKEAIEATVHAENQAVCDPPVPDHEINFQARDMAKRWSIPATGSPQFEIKKPDLTRVRPLEWAWKHRIGIGTFNLIVGAEGVGKSTLVARLVSQLSLGTLDGGFLSKPVTTLIVGSEDSFDQVWTPRLHAAGADFSSVRFLSGNEGQVLALPGDLRVLEGCLDETDAKVVYFDSFIDNLDAGVDEYRNKQVRNAVYPFAALAREREIAVIASLHTNKSKGGDFRSAVSGSHAFNALSRSSLLVAEHPEDEDLRVVARGKGNYAKCPDSLAFAIEEWRGEINGYMIETSVATGFQRCAVRVADLLSVGRAESHSKARLAREYISEQLIDGLPHDAKPISEYLTNQGLDERAIRRARKDIGAISERKPEYQGGTRWKLPTAARTGAMIDRLSRNAPNGRPDNAGNAATPATEGEL